MEASWRCPREDTPQVYEPDKLTQKGATAPRLDAEKFLLDWSPRNLRMEAKHGTFHWLLAELARAHDRELREAIAVTQSSMPFLVQGHIRTPRSPSPECQNVVLDGRQEDLPPVAHEYAATTHCPQNASPAKTTEAAELTPGCSLLPKADWQCVEKPMQTSGSEERPSRMRMSKGSTLSFKASRVEKQQVRGFMASLTAILKGEEFELAMALAIMMDALIMCCECQYVGLDVGFNLKFPGRLSRADMVWRGAEPVFNVLDWIFGVFFFLEVAVKIICLKSKYIYDEENWQASDWDSAGLLRPFVRFLLNLQAWHILDFLCVAAFVFGKVVSSLSAANAQLRLLRFVRVFRLVRLFRFLETLDHLYVMTTALSGLGKVLAWAVVLLIIMLLTCDLLLVQILQATYFDQVNASDLDDVQLKKHHEMYEYFGTCTRCMLSMFEITLGNFPPVARLLSEEVSEWFTLICLLHKITIGFAVIGVITGVILQETFRVAQTDDFIMYRNRKRAGNVLRKKMQDLFSELDVESDGKLTVSEFTSIGDDPEIKIWLASLDIETDDLKTLFALIDEDGSGFITLDELVARMPRIKGAARSIDMLAMKRELGY